MKASVVRQKYLDFFSARGHAIIPSAPLIPPNDPTTLFTSSGMQQLVPYLKGESHPMGTRLVDTQPSFRAEDIDEVGDNRHTCMFEMLGNWSLGDYFKQDQLTWMWQFYTQELGLDPNKLYITVFAGDAGVDIDQESIEIWQDILQDKTPAKSGSSGFDPQVKIYTYQSNWWSRSGSPDKMPVGEIGGPDSEIFYDFGEEHHFHENSPWADQPCHPNCDCGRFLEIGNSVFMQYLKTDQGMKSLPAKNVDFGGGLERIVAVTENTPDIFLTDVFTPIIQQIEQITHHSYQGKYKQPMRIIADHLRSAIFMASQGLTPSNKLQGYVMRRLLRRAVVHSRILGGNPEEILLAVVSPVVEFYAQAGLINSTSISTIQAVISQELVKFSKVLTKGSQLIQRLDDQAITEQLAFDLYQSMGFPFEITAELVVQRGIKLDQSKFNVLLKAHQDKSRSSSAGMFKGGLADHSQVTTRYHTATHLLHQALIDVLGDEVTQAGSNLNADRLRFDYTYSQKPTNSQLKQVIAKINQQIDADLPVHKTIETKQSAIKSGAKAFFIEKYPDKVTVYTIGKDVHQDWYSKELCGGPHVSRTGELPHLQLVKDKNLGAGKRRIYLKFV